MKIITWEDSQAVLSKDYLTSLNGRSVTVEGEKYALDGITVAWEGVSVERLINMAFEFVVVRKVQSVVKAGSYTDKGTKFLGANAVKAAIASLVTSGIRPATFGTRAAKVADTPETLAAKCAAVSSKDELDALIARLQSERERKFQING